MSATTVHSTLSVAYGMQRSGISGCTDIIRPQGEVRGYRGAECKRSECPLIARGGLHRGAIVSKPRCRPPRVCAADPSARTIMYSPASAAPYLTLLRDIYIFYSDLNVQTITFILFLCHFSLNMGLVFILSYLLCFHRNTRTYLQCFYWMYV